MNASARRRFGAAVASGLVGFVCMSLPAAAAPSGGPTPPVSLAAAPKVDRLVTAAEAQVGVTVNYDPSYVRLAYPGGDVPIDRGVCSDVVVRAFRAVSIDLQVAVHDDMTRNFGAYPRKWSLRRPDANIDHRRVYNLMTYFRRQGKEFPMSRNGADYKPGDIVAWTIPGNLAHVGVVSRQRRGDHYLMVHNIGAGTQLEDVLFTFPMIGHYRVV